MGQNSSGTGGITTGGCQGQIEASDGQGTICIKFQNARIVISCPEIDSGRWHEIGMGTRGEPGQEGEEGSEIRSRLARGVRGRLIVFELSKGDVDISYDKT